MTRSTLYFFALVACGGSAPQIASPQQLLPVAFTLRLSETQVVEMNAAGELLENAAQIAVLRDGRLQSADGVEIAQLSAEGQLVFMGTPMAVHVSANSVSETGVQVIHLSDDAQNVTFPTRSPPGPFALGSIGSGEKTSVMFVLSAYFALVSMDAE